jgi:hypothetical protein
MSILAVRQLRHVERYVMCVGLGTESGISEFDFLKNCKKKKKKKNSFSFIIRQKTKQGRSWRSLAGSWALWRGTQRLLRCSNI